MAAKGQIKEQIKNQVKLPRQYQVVIYNDDFTPMDFVVEVLVKIFGKEEAAAVSMMLEIHKGKYAVAGVYPRDVAQTKAAEAVRWAREEGHPLKVEAICV